MLRAPLPLLFGLLSCLFLSLPALLLGLQVCGPLLLLQPLFLPLPCDIGLLRFGRRLDSQRHLVCGVAFEGLSCKLFRLVHVKRNPLEIALGEKTEGLGLALVVLPAFGQLFGRLVVTPRLGDHVTLLSPPGAR